MYRAIFLDLDDTIFDFTQCSRQAFSRACRLCGLPDRPEAFAAFQDLDRHLWAQQKAGALTVTQVLERRAAGITAWFGRPDRKGDFLNAFSRCLEGECALEPGARETISFLAARAALYGASNGITRIQRARLAQAGLLPYFSGLFVSDQVGAEKPDPRFFAACLQGSGCAPAEVLMVGDSFAADILGAAQAGIDTCWYCPHPQPIPLDCPARWVISSLPQLCCLPPSASWQKGGSL